MTMTMRVAIGSSLYKKMIQCLEHGGVWTLNGKAYNISGARRIECTDFVRVELTEVVIK